MVETRQKAAMLKVEGKRVSDNFTSLYILLFFCAFLLNMRRGIFKKADALILQRGLSSPDLRLDDIVLLLAKPNLLKSPLLSA